MFLQQTTISSIIILHIDTWYFIAQYNSLRAHIANIIIKVIAWGLFVGVINDDL